MHTVYEYGRPVRTFLVGEGNPGYIPLNQISPFLQSAIMTSEDGAFYYHGGFLPDAFRDASKVMDFVSVPTTISRWVTRQHCSPTARRTFERATR